MEITIAILQTVSENGVSLDTGSKPHKLINRFGIPTVFWTLTFHGLGNLLKFQKRMTVCAAVKGTGRQIMSGYNVLFDTRRSKQMADADQHPLSNFDRWSGFLLEISLGMSQAVNSVQGM